jgi:ElaB/YqjD/DUF883 family membrane-anchored ribosome-binding protein
MADTLTENSGTIGSRLSDAAQRVQTAASNIKDVVVEKGGAVIERGTDAAKAVYERGGEAAKAVYEKSGEVAKQAHQKGEATIKAHPYTSVLVAFGVGALLGVALSRR